MSKLKVKQKIKFIQIPRPCDIYRYFVPKCHFICTKSKHKVPKFVLLRKSRNLDNRPTDRQATGLAGIGQAARPMKEFRPTGIRGYFLFPEVGLPDVGGEFRGIDFSRMYVQQFVHIYFQELIC